MILGYFFASSLVVTFGIRGWAVIRSSRVAWTETSLRRTARLSERVSTFRPRLERTS